MVQNKSVKFISIPHGFPDPKKDLLVETSEVDISSSSVPSAGIITKNLYVSIDPYQRGKMRDSSEESYTSAYPLGGVITNGGVGKVIQSNNPDFKIGDIVFGQLGWERYSFISSPDANGFQKINNQYNLPLSYFTGVLGMSGLTAYSALHKIGKPKKGETIFISAASGAVGQIVGQLAKHMGLCTIGSVGSDEKVAFAKNELKFSEAFNYKTTTNKDALKKLAPQGIDIYWENVGGEALEAALDSSNLHARFIICGMISVYNSKSPDEIYKPNNLLNILTKRLVIEGFIVGDASFGPAYAKEHQEKVSKWLANGEIVVKETITEGIDNAPQGFVDMLHGKNFGKAVLKVDHDE